MAYELIDRYGERAAEFAKARVVEVSRTPDRAVLDEALEILSAVATVLEEAANSEEVIKKH